jgi:hypothetical protein
MDEVGYSHHCTYLDCHDGVGWFMPHPIDGAVLTTPQLSIVTVILKIINVALE